MDNLYSSFEISILFSFLLIFSIFIPGFMIWLIAYKRLGGLAYHSRIHLMILKNLVLRLRYFGIIAVVLLFSTTVATAQHKGEIRGQVEMQNGELAFATILLLDNKSNQLKGTVADSLGYFNFKAVTAGNYLVKIENLGYSPYISAPINIRKGSETYDLGRIIIYSDEKMLETVVVTGRKPLFQQKSDRLTMNIEQSILADGSSALEILEKAPGIYVDQDGNISLRGKQGVNIMINGKLSYLSAKELGNLLKNTPSSSISTIDIIANPSAKYDAAGAAGIIDIKLKRNLASGTNGTAYANYGRGRKNRYGSGISLNYANEKVNVFGNYDHNYRGESETFSFVRNFFKEDPRLLDRTSTQQSTTDEPLRGNNAKLGASYNLGTHSIFGVTAGLNQGTYENINISDNILRHTSGRLISDAQTDNRNKEEWKSWSVNANFLHTFDKEDHQLTVDFDHTTSDFNGDQGLYTLFLPIDGQPNELRSSRRSDVGAHTKVYVAKADYGRPLSEQTKLEAGLKSSWVKADNAVHYDTLFSDNWVPDHSTSNRFAYREQIHAAYLNMHHKIAKFDIQAGLRLENTQTSGHQITTDSLVTRNYLQLFPSLFVKRELLGEQFVQFSYGRRIERPDYYDLNPFRFFRDPSVYYEGNPFLQPETTDALDVTYGYRNLIMATLFFKNTHHVMTYIVTQLDASNTTIMKPQNLKSLSNYGLTLSSSINLTRWWSANNFVNVYVNEYNGTQSEQNFNNRRLSYAMNSQNSIRMGYGWTGELNGQYHSTTVYGLYLRKPNYFVSAGVQKEFTNPKITVKLNVNDIFRSASFRQEVDYGNIDMNQKINLDSHIATFSVSYRFGKSKPIKRIQKEDDVQKRVKGAS